tara:strand:- start:69 stop:476 length:408 start_codon:yes stop_codon:yes gene_type:complete
MIDKEIFEIASRTENYGFLDNYSHVYNLKSSVCGDSIKIYLQVKANKIIKMKYEGNFCIYCNASASLLANITKNKTVKETVKFINSSKDLFSSPIKFKIKNKNWKDFKKIMNKDNIIRKECLLLPLKTLLKALNN